MRFVSEAADLRNVDQDKYTDKHVLETLSSRALSLSCVLDDCYTVGACTILGKPFWFALLSSLVVNRACGSTLQSKISLG